MRIVSLVPSLSHTVVELGQKTGLVGVTNFCVLPADLHRSATLIGGTKDPDINAIKKLSPDIIIVNTEENRSVDIEACRNIAQVVETFPKAPKDVPPMLRALSSKIEADDAGEAMAKRIEEKTIRLENREPKRSESFCYLIWKNPYMGVSNDTYISRTLELVGLKNSISSGPRYPILEPKQLEAMRTDYYLFSSEPFPFRDRNFEDFKREVATGSGKLCKIDGQLFSWYGALTENVLDLMRSPEFLS